MYWPLRIKSIYLIWSDLIWSYGVAFVYSFKAWYTFPGSMGVCMLIIGLGLWFSCLPYLPYYTLNIPWCFWWLITYKSSYFLVQCSYLPQAKVNTPEIGLGIIILVFEKQTSRSNLGNFFADLLIFHLFWVDNLFFFSCMKCQHM